MVRSLLPPLAVTLVLAAGCVNLPVDQASDSASDDSQDRALQGSHNPTQPGAAPSQQASENDQEQEPIPAPSSEVGPPQVPVIEAATVTLETRSDAHYMTLHLEVVSNVEVDWLNYRFTGPAGNILGGGSEVQFDETSPDIWEYQMVREISFDAPSGDYYWSGISVENVGELESDDWNGELSVYIHNG